MPRSLFPLALGSVLWLAAGCAAAVEFGSVTNPTVLGQPLNFLLTLKPGAEDSITAECVSTEVFVGDERMPPSEVRVAVEPAAVVTERILRVTTTVPIDEPVVSVNLVFDCPLHVAGRFLTFIDPAAAEPPLPGVTAGSPVAASSPQFEPGFARLVVVEAAPSGPSREATLPPQLASQGAANPRRSTSPVLAVDPLQALGAPGAQRAVHRASKVATARPLAARLRLDASDEMVRARLKLSEPKAKAVALAKVSTQAKTTAAAKEAARAEVPAPVAPAASDPLPTLDALMQLHAADREKIRAMEESLTQLRAEVQSAHERLAQVQARVSAVAVERDSNTLVYVLAAMVAVLGGAVGVLLWQVANDQRRTDWLAPADQVPEQVADAVPTHAGGIGATTASQSQHEQQYVASFDEFSQTTSPAVLASSPPEVARAVAPMAVLQVAPKVMPRVAAKAVQSVAPVVTLPTLASAVPELAQEMSIEELIDLEQRVEFFVLLGQDEAAVEVLLATMRSVGERSPPLPFLTLLDIYRRRNERDAYEQVRQQFNERFNTHAPDWDSSQRQGRSLEDYPHVLAKLQSLWASPQRAVQSIKTALLRRAPGDGTFDMPAYLELMGLYSIAHELAASGTAASGVDLFLPIGGGER